MAEQIAASYPSLTLEQVYATIQVLPAQPGGGHSLSDGLAGVRTPHARRAGEGSARAGLPGAATPSACRTGRTACACRHWQGPVSLRYPATCSALAPG